jgi:nucleotide-binding universal stress UspA family protein
MPEERSLLRLAWTLGGGPVTDTAVRREVPRIVVGYDGSGASNAALAWAAGHAAASGARLEVVAAWDVPISERSEGGAADAELSHKVEAVLGEAARAEADTIVVEGPPGPVLVGHSVGAGLVVVGCRGLGALNELLLGSVSAYVASRAHCPVVIVHEGDVTGDDPERPPGPQQRA